MRRKLFSFFALLLMAVTGAWADATMQETPLTLEAKTAGNIVVSNPQSGMQYSLNGGDKTAVPAEITVAIGDKVAFFGNSSIVYNNKNTDISDDTRFTGTADCYIYGNIMSLVDEENYASATTLTADSVFCGLFRDNTHLYNHATNDLVLPATTLSAGCYRALLRGCTHLTKAPALPATTLKAYCYAAMFYDCTSLTAAPALPATTLAERCYYYMFNGCTGLTSVPELPATTLADDCYNRMFSGCTGLTSVPANLLPITTLAKGCYSSMFYGCAELTTAPELPAETLTISCYFQMFAHCTKLTTAPELPATTLAESCYASMFYDCPLLAATPELPATKMEKKCYRSMFYGCNSLNAVPELPATTLADSCYRSMFYNCKGLTTVPTDLLPITTLAKGCYEAMFYGCNNLTNTPELPATTLADYCYYQMFNGCKGLTTVPTDLLPATTLAEDCYGSMFYGCNNLTKAPELPATTLASNCYHSMFYNCKGLTAAPALPATTLASSCYRQMFYGCTALTSAPELPAKTLASSCYRQMFYGCTALTSAPELPAKTLVSYCYYNMFYGCSNLSSVTCLATSITPNNSRTDWLNGVAAEGTFTKASAMNWGARSASKIPSGWTIVNNDPITLTDGDDLSSLTPCAGGICEVNYTREFTASKPSTVCLPFAYEVKDGEKFYTFGGITKEGDDFVATMNAYAGANLVANTPYLYVPASTGATDFSGTYTLPASITAGTTTSGDWKFVGTYTTQEWTSAPTGIYGFSAQATGTIGQGEFVKVGAYVRVKPMRSYLKYKNGKEDYHDSSVRGFSGFEGGMMTSAASESLPERIKVRFVDANGEVTGIGTLNTQTGDVNFDSEAWYTLDGIRLAEKPTQKGIYVNNGKKVMIK